METKVCGYFHTWDINKYDKNMTERGYGMPIYVSKVRPAEERSRVTVSLPVSIADKLTDLSNKTNRTISGVVEYLVRNAEVMPTPRPGMMTNHVPSAPRHA